MSDITRAVRAAYMLGRAGAPDRLDELISTASVGDEIMWREIASLKREVAVLRREVEASRSFKAKVIAMKKPDAE